MKIKFTRLSGCWLLHYQLTVHNDSSGAALATQTQDIHHSQH